MARNDRFLIAIVVGALVLVGAALFLAARQPPASYEDTGTPGGAVMDYFAAFRAGDYQRALSYIAPELPGHPGSVERLSHDVADNRWAFGGNDSSASYRVEDVTRSGDTAVVTVLMTGFNEGGLFESSEYSETFRMTLRQRDGRWYVVSGDRFWVGCWDNPAECERDPGYQRPTTPTSLPPSGLPSELPAP